jgi:hypothetical protein
MLRRLRKRSADRSDTEQSDLLTVHRSRRRRIPAAFLLRRVFLEHPPLVREQVAEHVL